MNTKKNFSRYLNEIALVPCLKPRPQLFFIGLLLLLRLISGHYPNKISFRLSDRNKCMLALWDIMLIVDLMFIGVNDGIVNEGKKEKHIIING